MLTTEINIEQFKSINDLYSFIDENAYLLISKCWIFR